MNDLKQFENIRSVKIDGIKYFSVLDAMESLGMQKQAAWRFINRNPDLCTKCTNFQFEGQGQREQPVAESKLLWRILGKTKTQKGKMIDDQAYNLLDSLLNAPEKLVEEVERVHGEAGVKIIKRTADYLGSYHSMVGSLKKNITVTDLREGHIIASVMTHNNGLVGLPAKGGRNTMSDEKQMKLTAIQIAQSFKLAKSDDKNYAAAKLAKKVGSEIDKYLSEEYEA